jgi:hypothetical protein
MMFDWTEKYGWALICFTFIFMACQLIRFFIGG